MTKTNYEYHASEFDAEGNMIRQVTVEESSLLHAWDALPWEHATLVNFPHSEWLDDRIEGDSLMHYAVNENGEPAGSITIRQGSKVY